MPFHANDRPPSLVLMILACLCLAASCEKPRPAEAKAGDEKGEVAMKNEPAQKQAPAFRAQVAGRFYPGAPGELRKMLQGYLDQAKKPGDQVKADLLGIVVPHAGYPYSGPVAAHAFLALKDRPIKRVVVLGPAHRRAFAGPALLDASAYQTPLGAMPIDLAGVAALAKSGAAAVDGEKFEGEHALEVELPFLQVVAPDALLVPIMISRLDPAGAQRLARALHAVFGTRDTVYVASTDMSHDYAYDVAVALDENALRYVTALDSEGLYKADQTFRRAGMDISVGEGGKPEPDCAQLCGLGPVLTLMELAKLHPGATAAVLDRRSSGDIIGDTKSRIVGYGAVAVSTDQARPEAKAKAAPKTAEHSGSSGDYLNKAEEQELLEIARKSLQAYLKDGARPDFEPQHAKLNQPGAAFVTLKKKGQLRGCIGYMEPADPLWKMIRDRAIDAAIHDGRFPKVTAAELPDLTVEISVLTPRVQVRDPLSEIVIGRDGVWLQLGLRRGVFLPQVPVEQGWDTVEIYLDHLCRKAGVAQRGCWKDPEAAIQRFTALVFSEEE